MPDSLVVGKSVGVMVAAAAVLVVASACSSSTSSTPSASPTLSDPDACLKGAWSVDMRLAAENAGAVVPGLSNRQATGTIDLGFTGTTFTTTYNMTLTGENPPSGTVPATTYALKFTGGSSADYTGNSTTLAMTNGSGVINVSGTQVVNGVQSPMTDVEIFRPIGNFTQGTLAYSCNADSLVLTNQSGVALDATRKG